MTDTEAAELLARNGYLVPPGTSRDGAAEAHVRAMAALRVKGMLVEALEAAQWGAHIRGIGAVCPRCAFAKDAGSHRDGCAIGTALAEARKEPT